MIEYWEPSEPFEKPSRVEWTSKSETGLYEFKKVRCFLSLSLFLAQLTPESTDEIYPPLPNALPHIRLIRDSLPAQPPPDDLHVPDRTSPPSLRRIADSYARDATGGHGGRQVGFDGVRKTVGQRERAGEGGVGVCAGGEKWRRGSGDGRVG
jgi:hypothetical protein